MCQEKVLTLGEDLWGRTHPEKDPLQERGTYVRREDSPREMDHGEEERCNQEGELSCWPLHLQGGDAAQAPW